MSRTRQEEIRKRLDLLEHHMLQTRALVGDLRALGHPLRKLPVESVRPARESHHNNYVGIRHYGGRAVSTGLRPDQRDDIQIALANEYDKWAVEQNIVKEKLPDELPANAGEHPIEVVLDYISKNFHRGRVGQIPIRGPLPQKRIGSRRDQIKRRNLSEVNTFVQCAREFYEGCILDDIQKDNVGEFILWQSGGLAKRPSGRPLEACKFPISHPGAAARTKNLFAAIKFYARRKNSVWDPGFTITRLTITKSDRLSKTDIARLLYGLLKGRRYGRVHPTNPDMRICYFTGQEYRFEQKDENWRARAHMFARFLLTRYYTGSRTIDVLTFAWGESQDAGHIFIKDLKIKTDEGKEIIVGRESGLFRQGRTTTDATKAAPDMWMFSKFASHCARWKQMDDGLIKKRGEAAVPIVRTTRDEAFKSAPSVIWKEALELVGLPKSTDLHGLKRACVSEMSQGGFSPDAIADFTGNNSAVVEHRYRIKNVPRRYDGPPSRVAPGPPATWRAEVRARERKLGLTEYSV